MAELLIVEDERGVREGLTRAARQKGYGVRAAATLADARALLEGAVPDCVLLDLRLSDGDGLELLQSLRAGEATREVPVLVVTAYGDSERTIAAMKEGAFDFVTKPFELAVLFGAVERAVRQRSLAQAVIPAAPQEPAAPGVMVGQSAAMLKVWKLLGRAAATDAPVLLTGESGTGKELVARAIHRHSARAAEPFVAVNLAALPATLLESELFGHEKGAFTGAVARRAGRVEQAGRGTLFLDELGDLEPALQTRLLRLLQEGTYERVGSDVPQKLQARVLAATLKAVRPGQPGSTLREDLYYRLAVLELEVPPLRERKSDIPLLVAHALAGTRARAVSEEGMALLLAYRWPGNVRQLLNVVQRAAVLSGAEVLDAPDLVGVLPEVAQPQPEAASADPYDGLPLREALALLEKRMLQRALERAGGNRAEAARLLGIARPQLYTKMEEHGLSEPKR